MEEEVSKTEVSRQYLLISSTINDLRDAFKQLCETSDYYQAKSMSVLKLANKVIELIAEINEVL
jgi:hypothetical protein